MTSAYPVSIYLKFGILLVKAAEYIGVYRLQAYLRIWLYLSHRALSNWNKYDFFAPQGVKIPVVVSIFPEEFYHVPQNWAEKAYPNMVYYKKHNKGGHFAAWKQPGLLVEDIREGFKSLR